MRIKVIIKDKQTGHVGSFEHRCDYTDNEDVWTSWRDDGNYGCDCNLGQFLYGEEHPCGDGRFEVLRIEDADTGALVFMGAELIV